MLRFDEIITPESLVEQYNIAVHGKSEFTNVIKYKECILEHLNNLYMRLINETYVAAPDRRFIITFPKKRVIVANSFEDKIVQGVLVRKILEPLIEPKLIRDNYASRKNMGTDDALDRLDSFLRSYYMTYHSDNGYILQGDIRKYFYNIQVPIAKEMLLSLDIDDKLKRLLASEIRPYDNISTGVCIGHEISQWIAIYYLNEMDHFIKENLRIKYYSRYMDDFILIHQSKEWLRYAVDEISRILRALNLELNENKTHITPISNGVNFLGYHHALTKSGKVYRSLLNKNIQRMYHRLNEYQVILDNDPSQFYTILDGFSAWKAHAVKGCARKIIYIMDIEFFNRFHNLIIQYGINYAEYCYLPGKYEYDNFGNRNTINNRHYQWAMDLYSKFPIDIEKIKSWPR